MEFQTLHNISESPSMRGKSATYSASPRGRLVLLLALAIVSVLFISLVGCSGQRDASRERDARERAAIASDSPSPLRPDDSLEGMDYDPWEKFNDKTFDFNFNDLDHYAIKPAAKVYAKGVPQQVRQSIANAFYNLAMPKRFVNKVLQGRLPEAGLELTSFVINTTVGVAGFFDVASRLGIKKSDADTGQTFGVYGIRPGPYLVLPLMPPLDLRDAFGFAADSFMDPLALVVTPIGVDIGRAALQRINERAENMKLYDDVEDTSLDLYAAVRNGYLQRRHQSIEDAISDRDRSWERISDPFEHQKKSMLGDDTQSTE